MKDSKSLAAETMRLLFRPIARIMLRVGMPWRELAEICKATYVEVASDDYGIRGRPTNVSRVAILTGLARRDVSRLRKVLADEEPENFSRMNHATRVLSGWYQDEAYRDANGQPKPLDPAGAAPSFESLCKAYCPNVAPVTMLKELKQAGAVEETVNGDVLAKSRVYMPLRTDPDHMLSSGSVLQDIGYTVAHNLHREDGDPSRFERRATNTRIPASAVPEFREFIETEGQAFLERVDAWLSANEQTDADPDSCVRLGMGAYWIGQESDERQKS